MKHVDGGVGCHGHAFRHVERAEACHVLAEIKHKHTRTALPQVTWRVALCDSNRWHHRVRCEQHMLAGRFSGLSRTPLVGIEVRCGPARGLHPRIVHLSHVQIGHRYGSRRVLPGGV